MDALSLFKDMVIAGDDQLMAVMKPVTPEQGAWKLPNSKANSITQTFLHIYYTEDLLLHRLTGGPTMFETKGWQQRLEGYDPAGRWAFEAKPPTSVLMEYAVDAHTATMEYLAGITADTFGQEVQTNNGPRTIANRLMTPLITHKFQHTGDISALLGCQGLQGLP